jgi:predicted amidohydrolase
MKIGLVQMDLAWEDAAANRRRAERHIQAAAALGARLVVLPEMFASGFSMRPERIAEPVGGPTEQWLVGVAGDLGVWVLAGVAEDVGPRNVALLVSPEGAVSRFAKLHPFSFAKEHEHYRSGDAVCTWTVEGLRITPFICYDLRFTEPFRMAATDTDLFVVIANWPERRRVHWQTLLRARAIENLAYVAGVNRVGDGDGLHYAGDSGLISPWGETLAGAAESEVVLVAEVDPGVVTAARAAFPVLDDRRSDYRRA